MSTHSDILVISMLCSQESQQDNILTGKFSYMYSSMTTQIFYILAACHLQDVTHQVYLGLQTCSIHIGCQTLILFFWEARNLRLTL